VKKKVPSINVGLQNHQSLNKNLIRRMAWRAFSWRNAKCCINVPHAVEHTPVYTHPFIGSLSGTTQVSRYQKGKTNLDFTEAWDSEWQWHQLGHMQVCTSLQTDNHASTPSLSFLQAWCPSCHPTNSINQRQVPHAVEQWIKCVMWKFAVPYVGDRMLTGRKGIVYSYDWLCVVR